MLKPNPRFHMFTDRRLYEYAVMCDLNAGACYREWKVARKQYHKDVGLFYRGEFWEVIVEIECRYALAQKGKVK